MQSLNVSRFFSVSTRLMAIGLVVIQRALTDYFTWVLRADNMMSKRYETCSHTQPVSKLLCKKRAASESDECTTPAQQQTQSH